VTFSPFQQIGFGPFHKIGDEPAAWLDAYRDYPYSVQAICDAVSWEYSVPKIGVREGVDLEMHSASLAELIDEQREIYARDYYDFLARRVYRPSRMHLLDEPGEFTEDEMAEVPAMYRAIYGKGRGNPGYFHDDRDRCDPPLSKFPLLVGIYHAANRWWRTHVLPPQPTFFPDFGSDPVGDDYDEDLRELNHSARFLVLVTHAIEPRYSLDEIRKVHDEYYRDLDRSLPSN
jgi:hypothetical protein